MTGQRSESSRAAFTLVELLIGATLSAAIMAAVLSSYIFLGRSLGRLANQQSIENTPGTLGYSSITYSYNSDPANASSVVINGINVTVPAHTLMRSVYNSTTNAVTSRQLLRNISDGDEGTTVDLRLRYYDGAGTAYDSGPPSYTPATISAPGIKMISLSFALLAGDASNGTQTPVYWANSGQFAFRNRALLQ
jgi:hypothetical protein